MVEEKVSVPDLHIGNEILRYLADKGKTQAYLARELNMPTSNLARILKRKSMETDRLFQICMCLDYNFFSIFGNEPNFAENYSLGLPNIGALVEMQLVKKKMQRSEFAEALGIKPSDVSRILKKTSFDTDKLVKISQILNHNFFCDFYNEYPDSENETDLFRQMQIQRMDELTIENQRLKYENEELNKKVDYLQKKLSEAGIDY